ncbi:hypothetical protein [Streptomyces sp. NPDC058142]|uniref:hypothetical protein n=1 Tax=Streptomyces sp. NPDC058142 TaxID=3346355 RepID=UPI0036E80BBC
MQRFFRTTPPKVRRSTTAAQSRGSVNTSAQPLIKLVRRDHDADLMVEDFAPSAADRRLAAGVHPRCPRCTHRDMHLHGLEDGIETAVLAVVVTQQEVQVTVHSRDGDDACAGRRSPT